MPVVIVESLDADRPARLQADADRPDNRRFPQSPDAGLHRHRPQSGLTSRMSRAAICSRPSAGAIGEKYILGGENLTLERILAAPGARSPGCPRRGCKIPYAVAYGFALGAEAVARTLTHRAPRASLTEVRMARKRMFFDSAKATAEARLRAGTGRRRARPRDRLFRRPGWRVRRRLSAMMHLLLSTIALRPYVFIFLGALSVHLDRQFRLRTTMLFTALTYAVALACEWSSVHNGFPFGLYHYIEATRGREIWVAGVPFHGFALVYLSRLRQLHRRRCCSRAALSPRMAICACSIPGRSGARRECG